MRRHLSHAILGVALAAGLSGCAAFAKPAPPPAPAWQGPLEDPPSAWAKTFLDLSEEREDRGDLEGALAAADKATLRQPHGRAAHVRRAELLVALDARDGVGPRAEEARAILAAAAGPDDPAALAAFARLDRLDGRRDEAGRRLERAAELAPESAKSHRLLSELLLDAGDVPGALAEADRALELSPQSSAARRARARARLARPDPEGAMADAVAAARTSADDDEAQLLLGLALLDLERAGDAARALESVPEPRRTAPLLVALGVARARSGDPAARATFEAAAAKTPTDVATLAALVALGDGRGADALPMLDAALAARPDDAALLRLRALALAAGGRPDEALDSARRAVELDPEDLEAYAALASILSERDRDEAQKAALELGLAPAPTHVLVGVLQGARGDDAGAVAQWRAALDADASLAVARIALALALADQRRELDLALALARDAQAERPADPRAAAALGRVLLERGDAREAKRLLRQAVQAWPPYHPALPDARFRLALALARDGEPDAARAAARAALGGGGADPPWADEARALIR